MNESKGLVLWIAGGAGITLLYAAYKGLSPLTILTDHISGTPSAPATPTASPSATPVTTANTAGAEGPVSYSSTGEPYSVGVDASGQQYVYDGSGAPISVLPANYSTTPSTYIPVEGTYDV